MKKYVVGLSLCLSLIAQDDFRKAHGAYVYSGLGFSTTSGRFYPSTGGSIGTVINQSSRKAGAAFQIALGHRATFGQKYFSGELFLSYDGSKPLVAYINNTSYPITYKPGVGLGLAIKGGYFVSDSLLLFLRLGLGYDFASLEIKSTSGATKTTIKPFNFAPGFGLEGPISEKVLWNLLISYKVVATMPRNMPINPSFEKKPSSLLVLLGVSWQI